MRGFERCRKLAAGGPGGGRDRLIEGSRRFLWLDLSPKQLCPAAAVVAVVVVAAVVVAVVVVAVVVEVMFGRLRKLLPPNSAQVLGQVCCCCCCPSPPLSGVALLLPMSVLKTFA